MPAQPSAAQVRLNNIVKCLTTTAGSLEVLAHSLREPSLEAISYTTHSLLRDIKNLKQNKNECIQLLEQTQGLLDAILVTHIKSDMGTDLPPSVLKHIKNFTETLHKVHTFIEAQQKGSKIRRLFHQGELATLLKDCKQGLQQSIYSFQFETGKIMKDITDIQRESTARHEEVLHLIDTLSDTGSDQTSAISRVSCSSLNSSTSMTMLPSEPKIFHGREPELIEILQLFSHGHPRLAILGAGGMGKTTVAQAVLHHTQIITKFEQHRHFVACDSAATSIEMAALLGAHLGLKPGRDLTQVVVQHLCDSTSSLLILDNLETVWEPLESRKDIEAFLSLLTGVEHLALIITMRGAERPGKVAWTHPFLPPLSPLEQDAARQIFIDIADDVHDPDEVDQVLALTDNMPLAISLLAHLADADGCSTVLLRWEEERTSALSNGWDRKSNLDLSIALSLSSPRLRRFPHANKLLSLLSMLPNGLSDVELVQSKVPINHILGCKTVLLSTSLAYNDSHQRLKVLMPVREYVQKIQPPRNDLIRPLRTYFKALLELYKEYGGHSLASGTVTRILLNHANIQNLLQHGLFQGHPDVVDCIYCSCYLSRFSRLTSQGGISLMRQIPAIIPLLHNHHLEIYVAIELLDSWRHGYIEDLETFIAQTVSHVDQCCDLDIKCDFYLSLALMYREKQNNLPAAQDFSEIAISLAIVIVNTKKHSQGLISMAWIHWYLGCYTAAQAYAKESQRLARISANLYGEANALEIGAACCYSQGDYPECLALCTRAKDLLTACGMSRSQLSLIITATQAEIHKVKSEYSEARNIHQQILNETLAQDTWNRGFALLNIAEINVSMNNPKDAVQKQISAANNIFSTMTNVRGPTVCDMIMADLLLREGDMPAAKGLFLKCLKRSWGKDAELVSGCLERLGDASRWDQSSNTRAWATVSLAHAKKFREKLLTFKALLSLGQIFLNQGDEDTATNLFNVALDGFTKMDVHCSRAECMFHLGDICKRRGDLLKAVELWDTARPLFERSSQYKQVTKIDARLASVGQNFLDQHRKSLASLAKLSVPSAVVIEEEVEDDLSDVDVLEEGALALV
ncbi:hypothetical protein C8R47DRAFT_1159459 [Mycena vitilis]|nr:hypothetical protein C8R47DRAFT_1159459 [Mycena vitilis]